MRENNSMEDFAKQFTHMLATIIELAAAVVIAIALVKFFIRYILHILHQSEAYSNKFIRIHFGSALTLSLELLLAADILATAIAPSWDDIGKLAAIAVLRTALNFFLEKELKAFENMPHTPA
jgi:uncharacterized membrane protein